MKTIKRILFIFLLFIFMVFIMWFMHETQIFNDMQIVAGMMFIVGILTALIIWIFVTDGEDKEADFTVKLKEETDG